MWWNIFGDHRACPGKRVLPDGDAANDDDSGAQRDSLLNDGWQQSITTAFDMRSWPEVVGENNPWAEKDIVVDADTIEQQHLILDGDAIPHDNATFDEGAVANVAVAADLCARQDMGKRPDPCAGTNIHAFAQTRLVNEDGWRCVLGDVVHLVPSASVLRSSNSSLLARNA